MVLCLIALPIFAILGVFSLRYRKLAKESLDCLFRTVTLRKCRSGLDERIKSDVTGKLMKVSPKLAKGFYKNYKLISILILILFIWATYVSVAGFYNYYKYGNCNGENSSEFCVLGELHLPTPDYDVAKIARENGLDENELAKCLEDYKYLGGACLNYCLNKS